MPKEIISAIIVGGILGLAIAFGVWRANIALSTQNQPSGTQNPAQPSPTSTSSPTELSLTITSPLDETVVDENPVKIIGLTSPNATVTISSDKAEVIIVADKEGNFTADLELSEGLNVVTITAFDSLDQTTEKQINIVYSTEVKQN